MSDSGNHIAGIDSGSVSVKLAVVDFTGREPRLVHHRYLRHQGRPLACALNMLGPAMYDFPGLRLAVTGGSGRLLARVLNAPHVNELSAFALSTSLLHPEASAIFEMGGEDSKLILLDKGYVRDFSLNSVCAAGTGAFLDQQAERMKLSLDNFAELALASKRPARIAGRCSVFAKSDMIHLQQIATPLEDIVSGLCFAVVRNFRGAIVRGRPLGGRAAFMGGVSLNRGVVRAFREIFGLDDLIIPEQPTQMGAMGAALKARLDESAVFGNMSGLKRAVETQTHDGKTRPRLVGEDDTFRQRHMTLKTRSALFTPETGNGRIKAYMGIDVGSISTNLALVDQKGSLLAKRYLRTASRPIEAVRRGLSEIRAELAERSILDVVDIAGVGTTGSGRYMIADFVQADVVKNEITAQATAAAAIDPTVDTIFEIGGQDSKFISLRDGVIVDFEMNKACAAGTGSFLEEQAEKLDVEIKGQFQDMALSAKAPCALGERCTVFMENSLQSNLQQGAEKDDILAGLAYSIVQNYINRVVGAKPIGQNIFFQGGTAFNRSVTAAFEKYLDREVTVPPNHDVTGAIGMALIARDSSADRASTFRGFDLADVAYSIKSFTCNGCDNQCEINRVTIDGREDKLFYGGRCEKYDIRSRIENNIPDLFEFRREALTKSHEARLESFRSGDGKSARGEIGLPMSFFMHDSLPWYSTLLWELGFEPLVSGATNKEVVRLGVQAVQADACFPVKTGFGHAHSLIEQGLKTLFIPGVINSASPGDPASLACPLTQSFPYQVRSQLRNGRPDVRILAPAVRFDLGPEFLVRELKRIFRPFGVGSVEIRRAMAEADKAQEEFEERIRERGRKFIQGLDQRALVICGRSYNAFDPGLNLDIPKKLAGLDVATLPMDFLPLDEKDDPSPGMYWRSGQRLLRAARFIRSQPNLFALQLGSFSCGPDSFIEKEFAREMRGKPYLHLEIDEHSADAGALTRCEAFLDSIDAANGLEPPPARMAARRSMSLADRIIYSPNMSDHCRAICAAFRSCGLKSEVMPVGGDEAVALARKRLSGKECYPCAVTTGDLLAKIQAPDFDPDRSAFFMPGGEGPCRFGQYGRFQRALLDDEGLEDVPLFSPMQSMNLYSDMARAGSKFASRSWEGVVAYDLLIKCLHRTRPYELEKGSADSLYAFCADELDRWVETPGKNLAPLMAKIRKAFARLPRTRDKRPVVGIVGEIFVRSNRFSNEDLVRKVEELGGEARLAGADEWIYYITHIHKREARHKKRLKPYLAMSLKDRIQKKIARRLENRFNGFLEAIHEPDMSEILKLAHPYLPDAVRGEAVLTIGKTLEMAGHGICGVVSAIPFGCMPGTLAQSLLREISDKHSLPVVTLAFDGTAQPTNQLTLETFMEQAWARI